MINDIYELLPLDEQKNTLKDNNLISLLKQIKSFVIKKSYKSQRVISETKQILS